jgi:hypothetical protein
MSRWLIVHLRGRVISSAQADDQLKARKARIHSPDATHR